MHKKKSGAINFVARAKTGDRLHTSPPAPLPRPPRGPRPPAGLTKWTGSGPEVGPAGTSAIQCWARASAIHCDPLRT